MIAARLRQCLDILRWTRDDLAEELGISTEQAGEWLAGRARPPVAVAAWLEALVKAHQALPRPEVLENKVRFGHLSGIIDPRPRSSDILQ